MDAATETARWLLREKFDGRLPALADTRTYLERWIVKRGHGTQTVLFALPSVAKKLHDMAYRLRVLMPPTPYTLSFGRVAVEGEYAVLESPRFPNRAMVLRLNWEPERTRSHDQLSLRKRFPDAVTLARWLYAKDICGHERCVVYHYPVGSGPRAVEEPDTEYARKWMRSLAKAYENACEFPAPGEHCLSCLSKLCQAGQVHE